MDYKITGYEPEKLFHFFEEISAIPRGSGNEKGISDYLVKFAKDRGLEVIQDDAYNVVIKKREAEGRGSCIRLCSGSYGYGLREACRGRA